MRTAIDLASKLASFTEAWQPRTVSLFNGHDVMVAKLRGDYHWHVHDDTDDFFLVLEGRLEIDLEDGTTVTLGPGQLYVVAKGVRSIRRQTMSRAAMSRVLGSRRSGTISAPVLSATSPWPSWQAWRACRALTSLARSARRITCRRTST